MIDFKEKQVEIRFNGEQVDSEIYVTKNDTNSRFIQFNMIDYDNTSIDCTEYAPKLYIKSDEGVVILDCIEEKSDKAKGHIVFDVSQANMTSQLLKAQIDLVKGKDNIQSRVFYINVGESLKDIEATDKVNPVVVEMLVNSATSIIKEFRELKTSIDNGDFSGGKIFDVNFMLDENGDLYSDITANVGNLEFSLDDECNLYYEYTN